MSVWRESIKSLIPQMVSKGFVVFLIATALLYLGKLPAVDWMWIALGFLGTNVLETYIKR